MLHPDPNKHQFFFFYPGCTDEVKHIMPLKNFHMDKGVHIHTVPTVNVTPSTHAKTDLNSLCVLWRLVTERVFALHVEERLNEV